MKREEIYRAVWATPMTKLSKELGVSGSYLARVCEVLNVPRPGRGYWAKLQAGVKIGIPKLHSQKVGEPLEWSKKNGYQGVQRSIDATLTLVEPPAAPKASKAGTHALINGARKCFESGRPTNDEIFLKPYKKVLVDITTSSRTLVRALRFANELFNALDSRGFRVAIASQASRLHRPEIDWHEVPKKPSAYPIIWKPSRPTVVYVGGVAIGIAIIEMAEPVLMRYVNGGKYIRDSDYIPPKLRRDETDWSWTTTKDIPTGRLRLQLYAPHHHVVWSRHWQETDVHSLEKQIPSIVNEMRGIGEDLTRIVAEADRKEQLRHEEWERELERLDRHDDRLEARKSRKESRATLIELIDVWERAESTRRFFESIEARLDELPAGMREEVLSRIALAKEFARTSSPWDLLLDWKTPAELYTPRYSLDDSEE